MLHPTAVRHPESVPVINNLAQTLSDEARTDDALALIDRALRIESPYADAVRRTRETIMERQGKR